MPPEVSSPPRGRGLLLALGLLFLVLYALFYRSMPRLPGEFSYVPPMDPLPFAPMRGFTLEQLLLHVGRLGLLGPALLLVGWGLAGWMPARAGAWGLDEQRLRRWALLAGALSVLLSAVVMTRVLHGRALVDDELTYRNQASMLADGRVGDDRIPTVGWEPFTITSRLGLTGKYLFGEPLVQVPGTLLGLPGLLHLGFGALVLLAWYFVVWVDAGALVASWATVLLALSPMFAITNGTGLAHSTTLLCVVLAGLGLQACRLRRPWAGALLAGNAIGFGCTVRPQVLLPVGAVIAWAILRELWRERRFGPLVGFTASGAFWVLLIGLYNGAVTGSPLTLPWSLFRPRESFGFAAPHSPIHALENLLVSVVRFNGWWLGLPVGLAVLAVWAALGRPSCGLRLWGWCGLALVAFNFCYVSPGVSDTGPVYYFELLLLASLLAAHTVVGALRRWPSLASSLLLVHLGLGTGSFFSEQLDRLARLHHAIHDRVDAVLAQIEPPALLIHEKGVEESLAAGWVFSFPVRYRSPRDPVVTYPRQSPREVQAVRALWADRRCYYYRIEPTEGRPELYGCDQAEALLGRAEGSLQEGIGRMPAPSAARLGYFATPVGDSAPRP